MARYFLSLLLVAATFAVVANGQTFNGSSMNTYTYNWTFHPELNTTVPLFNVSCNATSNATVQLVIPANQTHNLIWIAPNKTQTTFPSICDSVQNQQLLPTTSYNSTHSVTLEFETTGMFSFLCGVGGASNATGHCQRGHMAFMVNVTGTCGKTNTTNTTTDSPPMPMPSSLSPSPSLSPPAAPLQINWQFGVGPTTFNVPCGGSAAFKSSSGTHALVEIVPGGTCDNFVKVQDLQAITSGGFTKVVPFTTAGTRSFICNLSGHCANGMYVTVVTGACP